MTYADYARDERKPTAAELIGKSIIFRSTCFRKGCQSFLLVARIRLQNELARIDS